MQHTISLSKNRDFRWLYAKGKKAAGSYLAVYCRKNRIDSTRLGLTVSVKLGGAVQRNRIRRRMREAYRLQEDLFLPGNDIVIVARFRAVSVGFSALQKEMVDLCRGLGLLKVSPL